MGRPIKEKKRYIGENGLWYYFCIRCEEYKDERYMYKNKHKAFGVDIYCSTCKKEERYERYRKPTMNEQYGTSYVAQTGKHLRIYPTPFDDEDLNEYLTNMGYDTTQPIYLQFKKRIEDKYGVILEMDDIPYQEKEDNGL